MATFANNERTTPQAGFQFEVYSEGDEITWLPQGQVGFSEVDGLSSVTSVNKYKEGNDLYPLSLPGQTDTYEVRLRRGTDASQYLARWRRAVEERTALARRQVLNEVTINMYERQGAPGACESPLGPVLVRQWRLRMAWPSALNQNGLTAMDGGINIEELVLVGYGPPIQTYPEG